MRLTILFYIHHFINLFMNYYYVLFSDIYFTP